MNDDEHVCSLSGCDNPATRYPRVMLKPPGKDWGQVEPLVLLVPLPVCLDCQPLFDPQEFLGPAARTRIRAELLKRGKAMPDFDNPAVQWMHIGDKDWREHHAAAAASGATS